MTGMIQGGWEYVQASYAITFLVLAVYAVSVSLRLGRARAARRTS
jgi:hypothetical protein